MSTSGVTSPKVNHVVNVYVRLIGDDDDDNKDRRRISFAIPPRTVGVEEIEKFDLVKKGWAIDGNQAMADIAPSVEEYTGRVLYYGPFDTAEETLSEAIRSAQLALGEYLADRGIGIDFA